MKRFIGTTLALVVSVSALAQSNDQIQNKNGVDIMPVSGEWGVGMNAAPVFQYVGNMFGYTANNTAMSGNKFVNYFAGNTLFGKYMLSDDNAVRGHFRFGEFSNTYSNWVYDDTKNSPDSLVMDTYTSKSSVYNIGVGYEFRRGKNRLRGIYGGEVMYQYQKSNRRSYDYGNQYGFGNPAPIATSWSSGGGVFGENPDAERIVSQTFGAYNGFGVRGFVGVEYYIAPKICFGTEFGWGLMYGKTGEGKTVTEYWDPTATATDGSTGAVMNNEVITAGSKGFSLDTDNFGGSLYLMFYF